MSVDPKRFPALAAFDALERARAAGSKRAARTAEVTLWVWMYRVWSDWRPPASPRRVPRLELQLELGFEP